MGDEFNRRFEQRVIAFLANENPEVGTAMAFADVDDIVKRNCDRLFGQEVRTEIAREIKGAFTRKLLRDKGLASLLDPPAA
jgi:hypothetical protein